MDDIERKNYRKFKDDIKISKKDFKKCIKSIKNHGYHIESYFNSGGIGGVYIVCTKTSSLRFNCKYVIKVQLLHSDSSYLTELEVLKRTKKFPYTPYLYENWECDGLGFFVMNRLVKCQLTRERKKDVENILKTLDERYKILHLDIHKGNIMCDPNTKNTVIIDFGYSAIKNRPDLLLASNFLVTDWEYNSKEKFIPDNIYIFLRDFYIRDIF